MSGAREYAEALFALTEELGTTERVRNDIATVVAALAENPDYVRLLDTPAVSSEEKIGLVGRSFQSTDPMLENLICILCEKRAMHLFPAIAKAFDTAYDEARGILRATAITAVPMKEEQRRALEQKLSEMTGKQAIVVNRTDRSVLGGVKLRYAGVQLDGSVKARLDRMERSLKSAIL